jgi:hypothetical protein
MIGISPAWAADMVADLDRRVACRRHRHHAERAQEALPACLSFGCRSIDLLRAFASTSGRVFRSSRSRSTRAFLARGYKREDRVHHSASRIDPTFRKRDS